MTDQLPEITEVQRLRLEPGDKLVVRADMSHLKMTQYDAEMIQRQVRAVLHLPDDFPVLVLPAGMSVEVVSAP